MDAAKKETNPLLEVLREARQALAETVRGHKFCACGRCIALDHAREAIAKAEARS